MVLPGGQIYLSRGFLSLAKSESEVAGAIAHAMSHVMLRHGTEQASRAYLSRAGLAALGGFVGSQGTTARIAIADRGPSPSIGLARLIPPTGCAIRLRVE